MVESLASRRLALFVLENVRPPIKSHATSNSGCEAGRGTAKRTGDPKMGVGEGRNGGGGGFYNFIIKPFNYLSTHTVHSGVGQLPRPV